MRFLLPLLLMSGAAVAADLNIYTYDSFTSEWGPGPALEEAFEAQCECDIVFTPAGDGAALLTRLKIEGDKTDADIALGLDQNLIGENIGEEMFQPHEEPAQIIHGSDLSWDDPDFMAYDWGQFAFVYRKSDVEEVPLNFEALGESALKIVIEDPRASTPGLGLALWIYDIYGDEAETVWSGLKDNIVTITPGWSEAYALFLQEEADMVLSYTTSPAYHRIAEEDDGFAAAVFEEGHGLQIELAGILKTSKAAPLAKDFLSFLRSLAAQEMIMGANWMYPVVALDLPEGFDDPSGFSSLPVDLDPARKEDAIKAFENGLN